MNKSSTTVKVYNAQDKIQAQMIIDTLKAEGIPAYSQGASIGEYMSIYQGFSVYGENIYVNEANEEKAKKIITEIFGEESNDEAIEKPKVPFYKNPVIIARIILGYALAMIIITQLMNYFMN